jgi:arylsulfatase A-like enzyme
MKASRAILVGWALGVFESGLVLSSILHYSSGPWFVVMSILAPMLVYGWGGWILSRLPGSDRYPWETLLFLGALVLVHLRRHLYVGTHGLLAQLVAHPADDMRRGFGLVGLAALAGLLLWQVLRDPERRSRGLDLLHTFIGLYLIARLRHFSSNGPQDPRQWLDLAGHPFAFAADWPWVLAAALFVAWIWAVPARLLPPGRWVTRTSAAALLLPFLSVGYLWTSIEKDPLRLVAPEAEAEAAGPNVVLVTWDTVRADTLPLYGGGGLDTPHLDRLAGDGVMIERYHTIAPITAPAHNSMLTGMYPPSHGLRANGKAVNPGVPRMPELFRREGWATGAFVSALPVKRQYGFFHGFEVFDDRPRISPVLPLIHFGGFLIRTVAVFDRFLPGGLDFLAATTAGDVTTGRAIDWIEQQDRPFFTWVHLFDAHDPRDTTGPFAEFVERVRARADEGPKAVNPECQESLVLQRAEIEFLDHQLGRLLETLEAKDPGLANTIVVLVADHGECFGEGHDEPEFFGEGGIQVLHTPSLYEATQHVAFVIKPQAGVPGLLPGGARLDLAGSSHLDLMPTLMQLAGLERALPQGLQGRTLLPALQGEEMPARGLYLEAYGETNLDGRLQGWVEDGWKYVRTESGKREFLYDLSRGDGHDFIDEEPERAARMRGALERALEGMTIAEVFEGAGNDAAGLAELGYAGS